MKLGGRQTKQGVRTTANAFLAEWYSMLPILNLLESGMTVEQLRKYAQTHVLPGFDI
jgi:hypothetical protein